MLVTSQFSRAHKSHKYKFSTNFQLSSREEQKKNADKPKSPPTREKKIIRQICHLKLFSDTGKWLEII